MSFKFMFIPIAAILLHSPVSTCACGGSSVAPLDDATIKEVLAIRNLEQLGINAQNTGAQATMNYVVKVLGFSAQRARNKDELGQPEILIDMSKVKVKGMDSPIETRSPHMIRSAVSGDRG